MLVWAVSCSDRSVSSSVCSGVVNERGSRLGVTLPMIWPLGWRGGCQLRVIQVGFPSTATGVRSRGALPGAARGNQKTCMIHQ